MSRTTDISDLFLELLDKSLERTARARATSLAGKYGYDDWFRDWMQGWAEASVAHKTACDILFEEPVRTSGKAANTTRPARKKKAKSKAARQTRTRDGRS